MNIIKYYNPKTGHTARVRVAQSPRGKRPSVREADILMKRKGYVRWKSS